METPDSEIADVMLTIWKLTTKNSRPVVRDERLDEMTGSKDRDVIHRRTIIATDMEVRMRMAGVDEETAQVVTVVIKGTEAAEVGTGMGEAVANFSLVLSLLCHSSIGTIPCCPSGSLCYCCRCRFTSLSCYKTIQLICAMPCWMTATVERFEIHR